LSISRLLPLDWVHHFCKHRERLAVQREGGWETYTNVAPEDVAELLSSCA